MRFYEKLKSLRLAHQMTQADLAKKVAITQRALANYESGKRIPQHETLLALSNVFDVSLDYLLSREEEFIVEARDRYGLQGKVKAMKLIEDANGLFSGGELADEDKDAFFRAITDIYFESKQRAKKYRPKKVRGKGDSPKT
jgi:transcriptional regulator with XRE-family HTH domain